MELENVFKDRWLTDEGIKVSEEIIKELTSGEPDKEIYQRCTELVAPFEIVPNYNLLDLRGSNVHGVKFEKIDLWDCDFRYAQLSDCSFRDLDFAGANDYARMINCSFTKVSFQFSCVLQNAELIGCSFREVYDVQLLFWNSTVSDCTFIDCPDVLFRCANNTTFKKINISNSVIRFIHGSWPYGSLIFEDSILPNCTFKYLISPNTTFTDCDLSGCDFNSSCLIGSHFISCNLENAKFDHARLRDVVFTDCNMVGCTFDESDYESVEFTNR